MITDRTPPDLAVAEHPLRACASLWRWYRPNLREPGLDPVVVSQLVSVVLVIVLVSLLVSNAASIVIKRSAFALRKQVFESLLDSRAMRQHGLSRSSTVSRHTTDVDHVAESVQSSLEVGLPAVIRVLLSLILLTLVDWRAGVVMWIAAGLLMLWHHIIGRRLFAHDRARLDASSAVGQLVDESISGARTIAGLHVGDWQRQRFGLAVDHLQDASEVQANTVTRMAIGSQAVGLAGLLAVVLFAGYAGGPGIARIAAALLYVEAVVSSLLVLPPWLRTLQLGVTSRQRIDEVLDDPGRLARPIAVAPPTTKPLTVMGLTADVGHGAKVRGAAWQCPATGLLGLVMPDSASPQRLLAILAGDESPDGGAVTFRGHDVRSPACDAMIKHVPDEAAGFSASALACLRATNAEVPEYSNHWHAKLAAGAVDLSVLGVDSAAEQQLHARLVSETYPAGDIIYRQGSPANRTFFIISGHVEIVTSDSGGVDQRVAVLGPGNHCGDLRLAPGELRAESARALNDVVVRSLSREAISAGLAGLLDLPADQRQVVGALLRHGSMSAEQLIARMSPMMTDATTRETVRELVANGDVREVDSRFFPVLGRRRRRTTSTVFDRLTDL